MNLEKWVNKVHCMDCLIGMRQLPGECIDLIVTSPPYNCRKDYGQCQDEWPWPGWYEFMSSVLAECKRLLVAGGTLAIVIPGVIRWQREHKFKKTWSDYDPGYPIRVGGQDSRGRGRIEPAGFNLFGMMQEERFRMREPIIWVKAKKSQPFCSQYKMGCDSNPFLRACYEFILLGSKERWYHDGGTGRRGSKAVPRLECTKDVWHIPTARNSHPAAFPEEIPLRLIQLFVHRSNTQKLPEPIILDPFMGSGTTAKVSKRPGHRFIGFETNPEYIKEEM